MVADPWGAVHAYWVQVPRAQDSAQVGIISLLSLGWTGVVGASGCLYAPNTTFRLPKAAIDGTGQIHLVWTMGAPGARVLQHRICRTGRVGSGILRSDAGVVPGLHGCCTRD